MNKETRLNLYDDALKAWGKGDQLIKAAEECGELVSAICKYHLHGVPLNAKNGIIEEIADVEIMIEQMKYIFGKSFEAGIDDVKEWKLIRLKERIDQSRTLVRPEEIE